MAITMTSSYHTEQHKRAQLLAQRRSLVDPFSVPMITADFWEVPLCSLLNRYQRFEGTCRSQPMEAGCSTETSETLQQVTRCQVTEVHVFQPTWVFAVPPNLVKQTTHLQLCRGQENVDLYIHSPIRLHGVMLN
jgi:hypothetical protein